MRTNNNATEVTIKYKIIREIRGKKNFNTKSITLRDAANAITY